MQFPQNDLAWYSELWPFDISIIISIGIEIGIDFEIFNLLLLLI